MGDKENSYLYNMGLLKHEFFQLVVVPLQLFNNSGSIRTGAFYNSPIDVIRARAVRLKEYFYISHNILIGMSGKESVTEFYALLPIQKKYARLSRL